MDAGIMLEGEFEVFGLEVAVALVGALMWSELADTQKKRLGWKVCTH